VCVRERECVCVALMRSTRENGHQPNASTHKQTCKHQVARNAVRGINLRIGLAKVHSLVSSLIQLLLLLYHWSMCWWFYEWLSCLLLSTTCRSISIDQCSALCMSEYQCGVIEWPMLPAYRRFGYALVVRGVLPSWQAMKSHCRSMCVLVVAW
jgi:hypothetical protein